MSLIVVGINHKTAAVNVRERFSFSKKHLDESLVKLKESPFIAGAVILSTCNRAEVYIDAPLGENHPDFYKVESFVFDIYNAAKSDRGRYFYILGGALALRHLFRVACGLDSQVLGEIQILEQVLRAWLIAQGMKVTSAELDKVFEKAYDVGRIARSETDISQGNISTGSVAIDMLEERFADLKERAVLIIGAGKIGAIVSKYLRERKMRGIFVASRTYSRALELASSCGGRAVDFSQLHKELGNVDIVISSTSSPHIILKKEAVAQIMSLRKTPLFIMDLAVPRDVDPGVKEIKGVSLCDLDDLKIVVGQNQKRREAEAVTAEEIIQREINNFLSSVAEEYAF